MFDTSGFANSNIMGNKAVGVVVLIIVQVIIVSIFAFTLFMALTIQDQDKAEFIKYHQKSIDDNKNKQFELPSKYSTNTQIYTSKYNEYQRSIDLDIAEINKINLMTSDEFSKHKESDKKIYTIITSIIGTVLLAEIIYVVYRVANR